MALLIFFCLNSSFLFIAAATEKPEAVPSEAGIEERLDGQVSLDLPFTDSSGKTVSLRDLLSAGRPAVLNPVYFSCPRLCRLTLAGMAELLNSLDLRLGEDFSVVSFSFNSQETEELSSKREKTFHKLLKSAPGEKAGWHFVTGPEQSIQALTKELGFHFKRDGDDFEHSSAIMIVTPSGRISRYFYGVNFPPAQVRYSLVEAADGKIGSTADRAFLYCFRYDRSTGRYTPVVWNIVRLVSFLTCLAVFAVILILIIRERRKSHA